MTKRYYVPLQMESLEAVLGKTRIDGKEEEFTVRIPGKFMRVFETREEAEKHAPNVRILEMEVDLSRLNKDESNS